MNTKLLKIISIPLITFVNFVVGFLPYLFIMRRARQQSNNRRLTSSAQHEAADHSMTFGPQMHRFLTLANFFCGGVFLSTCFIGLYPSVQSKFQEVQRTNKDIPHYPYEALSLAIGFFVVWWLEILVHACLHCNQSNSGHNHSHADNHSSSSPHQQHKHNHSHSSESTKKQQRVLKHSTSDTNNLLFATSTAPQSPEEQMLSPRTPACEPLLLEDEHNDMETPFGDQEHHHEHHQEHHHEHHHPMAGEVSNVEVVVENSSSAVVDEAHSHMPIKGNLLGSIMLTFALGSHSIIEGLGFAMIPELGSTIQMLVTVLIHESVCAFSLGVNLASKKTKMKMAVILLVTFSILIPAGLAIGLLVNLGIQQNSTGDIVTGLFQGIAAGTFLYVVFMEILPHELLNQSDSFLKVVMMMLGFAVIGVMKTFHSHSSGTHPSSNETLSAPLLIVSSTLRPII